MKFNGDKLRSVRKPKMTQTELAGKIGAAPSTISMLETGEIENPTIKLVEQIANALEVHWKIFFDDDMVIIADEDLNHMPEDLKHFLKSESSVAYVKFGEKMYKEGISPDTLEKIILGYKEVLRETSS